jgi:hypothetical protein
LLRTYVNEIAVCIIWNSSATNGTSGVSRTVELQLAGLTGTVSHRDMQKFRIIGFFFENRLHWLSEVGGKNSTNGCFRQHIYLPTNKTLIRNLLYYLTAEENFQP